MIINDLLNKEKKGEITEEEIFLCIKKNRKFYEKNINFYLSKINISNATPIWWAFNFTSKNPLNSNFFEKLMIALALIDIHKKNSKKKINYNNLTYGQRSIINQYFNTKRQYFVKSLYNFFFNNIFF